jgi:23S rRNA (uracil1939-C5)-methyltransferase
MTKRDNRFEVRIEAMAHGGSGLGHWRGKTVFVPFTIPGELVLVELEREYDHYLMARGLQLMEASADRTYPACPDYFSASCVRCAWQHIDYAAQLLLKQDVLADQLERMGKVRPAELRTLLQATIPAVEQWGYLHHVTYLTSEAHGQRTLGLPAREGRRPVHDRDCALIHPDLLALNASLDLDLEGIWRVRLMRGSDGALMIILSVQQEEAPELALDFPASINLLLPDNEPVNLLGDTALNFALGNRTIRVTVGGFVHPNAAMLPVLANAVRDLLHPRPHDRLLDLYAGGGTYSAALCGDVSEITLVESYPPSASDALVNLAECDNVTVIEGGVETVLPQLEGRFDAAVVEPPSAGLSGEAIGHIAAAGVGRLVYVSDDPATLARDARALARRGFTLTRARAIDLMPQTSFIDSLALFERRG